MVRSSTARVATAAAAAAAVSLPSWARVIQKGQSADALLKRLKTLRSELAKAELDQLAERVLDEIRTQLIHDDLLFHKTKEVRTTLAVCLAELLRLYAPRCPFTDGQLLAIFTFFLKVLTSSKGGLAHPNAPQYTDCVQLLSNLVSTQAFALLCEHANNDKPIVEYAKAFFDLVRPDTHKNVELLLCESMSQFVQYSYIVPDQLVEIIIANFHPKVKRSNPAAAHLAELIGNAAADDLQTAVAQYFHEVILQATQIVDEEDRDSDLHAAHVLISHMHKYAPMLLVNVIPLLDEEMRAEDPKLRLLAVRTLGHIFADQSRSTSPSSHSSIQRYPTTWKAWLGRSWDKSNSIRIAWLESIKGMTSFQDMQASSDLMNHIEQKLFDPDEKVRLAAIHLIASMEHYTLRKHVPRSVLQTLGERVKDKKPAVRFAALDGLGKMFKQAYGDLQAEDRSTINAFAWIPKAMTEAMYVNDGKGTLSVVQASFEKYILPLPVDTLDKSKDDWMARFFVVLRTLDQEGLNVLLVASNLQGPRTHLYGFFEACKRFNGGVVDSSQADSIRLHLLRCIGLLAEYFPDPQKAGQDLNAFAQANDARTYKLFASIMQQECNLEQTIKLRKELERKLEPERFGVTLLALVRLASFPLINSTSVPYLLEALQSEEVDTTMTSMKSSADSSDTFKASSFIFKVLKAIASTRPKMLSSHVATLKDNVHDQSSSYKKRAASLMALAKLTGEAEDGDIISLNEDDVAQLKLIIEERNSSEEAKWASKLLSVAASDMSTNVYASAFEAAEEICRGFANDLSAQEPGKLVAGLTALRQIAKNARDALTEVGDSITQIILKDVLMTPLPTERASDEGVDQDEAQDAEQEWREDEELSSDVQARLVGIRFLTDRCAAYADHDEIETIATPVLRLLITCMTQGETAPGLCLDNGAAKSRLRFEGAARLIKLARKSACDKLISVKDFQLLSHSFQDVVWQLRNRLARKLMKYAMIRAARLPSRFYILGFMVAFDPEIDNINMVRSACDRLLAVMKPDMRLRYFDIGLARLIHLLNHHPDFENAVSGKKGFSMDALTEVTGYFNFYLECCATRDNLPCLHHIASRCKGMRDVFDEDRRPTAEDDGEASRGIHTLSDLCICLIKAKADSLGVVVGSWQGQIALPRDLYLPYESREEQAKVLNRSYLTDEAIEHFSQPNTRRGERFNAASSSKKRKLTLPSDVATPRRTKKRAAEAARDKEPKSKRKAQRRRNDDTESEMEETDEDEDEEDEGEERDDEEISEDETIEDSDADETKVGRGERTRQRLRKEKVMRNEGRRQRREARAAKDE